MAPVIRERKGEYRKLFAELMRKGYSRVRADGTVYDLSEEEPELEKNKKHSIEAVVDRLIVKPDIRTRLADSLEAALHLADGLALAVCPEEEKLFSQNYACTECGISIQELEPRSFSFNSPFGACPACTGLGTQSRISPELLVTDPEKSLAQGAVRVSGWNTAAPDSIAGVTLRALAEHYGFSLDTPVNELPPKAYNAVMYGSGRRSWSIGWKR